MHRSTEAIELLESNHDRTFKHNYFEMWYEYKSFSTEQSMNNIRGLRYWTIEGKFNFGTTDIAKGETNKC